MANQHKLRILNWNGRSVLRKQLEYFEFLNRQNIDVAAVTETWLKPTNSFLHPNYYCLRADRLCENADRGGGVMLTIKKGLIFKQIDINTKVIEATGILLDDNGTAIKIVAVYFPGAKRRNDWQHFRNDLRLLTQDDVPTFVVGDLNARSRQWNCSKSNKAGTQLTQVISARNFYIHAPDTSTFHPTGRGRSSTLDLTLSNNLMDMSKPVVHNELSSDHLPVTFTIDSRIPFMPAENTTYCYARANWPRFQRLVDDSFDLTAPIITELNDSTSVDAAIELFTNTILHAETQAVPKVPIRAYDAPEISHHTKNLICLRNRRRRQWIRTRDPFYKAIVESLNNRIREECAQSRFQKFGDTLNTLELGGDKMWKITRALRKNCKYSPPLRNDGLLVASPQLKAEVLAENFSKAHNNTLVTDTATTTAVADSICLINESTNPVDLLVDPSYLVRPKEVKQLVKNLKSKKSPGYDKIRNQVLKHMTRKSLIFLSKIFTVCLRISYFPDVWKHAIITPVPKPGKDITNPANYRPISLLSTLGKLLERIILTRMERHLEAAQVIPNQQFGFKRGHSTNHQLVRLTKDIKSGFASKKSSGMLLLDVEKAYDSVWQEAILHKMVMTGFPMHLTRIVKAFLKNRSFQVTVNGTLSERRSIPYGVPQGSVLSPTLYNIFTADVVMIDGVQYYIFADDTAFVVTDSDPEIVVTNLQAAQNALEEFQRKWKVKINPTKTQAIYFTNRRSPRHLPRRCVSTGGHEVEWSKDVKYLGLHLDQKLKFGLHIQKSLQTCDKLVKSLYSLICRRSHLSTANKLLLYKAVIRPTITYGFPAWCNCARTHRKKLQTKQNRLLKMMLNLDPFHPTEDLHRLAGVQQIDEWIQRLLPKFWTSCNTSLNPLLQNISPYLL